MRWLLMLWLALAAPALAAPGFAVVKPGVAISFPRDHGAHRDYRTEWWYVTGWLKTVKGEDLGFQITFFRTRMRVDAANPSAFVPGQILFAHAAISDPATKKLRHSQRIARSGFGLAGASTADTHVVIDDWRLKRGADGRFTANVAGDGFALDLVLTPTQAEILQGERGYSRKGPAVSEASHYYSLPHLQVSGRVTRGGKAEPVSGTAWLDREWSSTLLNPRAVGWDWLGINMDDGGALTLFRVRDAKGGDVWAGGSYRNAKGLLTKLGPEDVRFLPGRTWKSPRTGAVYPVAPRVMVRLNKRETTIPVTPLFDDQELDSRRGGGPVYWEGAVKVPGGRGYLEMTGYAAPLTL
jgi:predicted secreted hydrolase